MTPHVVLKNHYLTKYEGKGTKISMFKPFNEFGKFWKCNLGFTKIQIFLSFMNWGKLGNMHSPRSIFKNPNMKSMDELGKVMS